MDDDIKNAVAEATEEATPAETKPEPEAEAADTETEVEAPAEEQAEEPAEAEETPEEDDDEPLGLSAEELAEIEKDPRLLRTYKSMQRGLTKGRQADKAQIREYEAKVKEAEEAIAIAKWIDENPDKAVEALSKHVSKKNTPKTQDEAVDDTVDAIMERAKHHLQGNEEAAKILAPLVKDIAEMVAQGIVRKEIDPIRSDVQAEKNRAAENTARTEINKFGSTLIEAGEEWNDDIVADMADLMDIMQPGKNVDPQLYFRGLYDHVTSQRNRSEAKRSALKRLRAAKTGSEPTRSARPAPESPSEITDDMDEREAIRLAVEQATAAVQNA